MSNDEAAKTSIESYWPPDIVENTLPFLSKDDIRNLSMTNKYFYKLLDYKTSDTLWHELFHKVFSTLNTNEEPFESKNSNEFRTAAESIICQRFPDDSWQNRYETRTSNTYFYTWGCLQHGRLGYTGDSNDQLTPDCLNNASIRVKYGVNKPTKIPWFDIENDPDNFTIAQISGGGFSFQILTKSGKIYSTGSSFTGGNGGPGPRGGESDYDPFGSLIRDLESSLPRIRGRGLPNAHINGNAGGRLGGRVLRPPVFSTQSNAENQQEIQAGQPHQDVFADLSTMERLSNQTIPNNKHVRRMFVRNSFSIYDENPGSIKDISQSQLDLVKFVAISSGRSHFLALDEDNNVYAWDTSDSNHGVLIKFKNIDTQNENPILKIACGWDFNCVYIYDVGLVYWSDREPLKKGQEFSFANYTVVPETSALSGDGKVIDFACIQNGHLVYVTNNGEKLWEYKNNEAKPIMLGISGVIDKITICYSSLVIFSDNCCYRYPINNGVIDFASHQKLELEDTKDRIVSISSGDYHTIALTQFGHLYSWGLESQNSGCLGLGSATELQNEAIDIEISPNLRDIKVLKPIKIKLEDNQICVTVSAGGWQSGALIIETNDQ